MVVLKVTLKVALTLLEQQRVKLRGCRTAELTQKVAWRALWTLTGQTKRTAASMDLQKDVVMAPWTQTETRTADATVRRRVTWMALPMERQKVLPLEPSMDSQRELEWD